MSTRQTIFLDTEHPDTEEMIEVEITFVYTQGYAGDREQPPVEDDIEILYVKDGAGVDLTQSFTRSQIDYLEGRIFTTDMS